MNTEQVKKSAFSQWAKPEVIWRFLKFVFRESLDNQGLENAKSLTYMSLFAVVPLLTLLLAILSAFPSFQVFGNQIQSMIFERLLPSSSSELESYLTEFSAQAKNLTWIGAVMLLGTAYLMLVNVERSFNQIWNVPQQRQGIASFLLYWSVLSLSPLLLGLGFAISSYIASFSLFEKFTEMSDFVGASSLVLNIFPTILTTGAFTLVYVAVPNCGVRLRHALTGGLVVALLFIIVKWVFSRFIATASYEFVYGTFAAMPIFLIWLYVCWVVILFGANLVRAIPVFRTRIIKNKLHPTLLVLALLNKLWINHRQGNSVSVRELIDNDWPFQADQLDACIGILLEQKIIRACGENEYILNRDLDSLNLWDLQSLLPWGVPGSEDFEKELPASLAGSLPAYETLESAFASIEGFASKEFSHSVAGFFRDGKVSSS
jgi:membrane protein